MDKIYKELDKIKRTSFGISIPELRKYAKNLAKNDYEYKKVLNNPPKSFEMKLLRAFLIGYIKDDIDVLLKYFEDFMPYVDDWAVCDSLCQNFKIARKYQNEVWKFILKYKNSKSEFYSRIVAVILLSHYLSDEYIEEVLIILDNLNTDRYYSQMGVAWAIATIAGKYPKRCINYLKTNKLDTITYNKSLQKIKESFRVDESFKKQIKELVKTTSK